MRDPGREGRGAGNVRRPLPAGCGPPAPDAGVPAPGHDRAWTAEQRYRWLVTTAPEAIWRFELDPPAPLDLSEEEVAAAILDRGRLAECNPAFARRYGHGSPRELTGARVADVLFGDSDEGLAILREFVRGDLRLTGATGTERTRDGQAFAAAHDLVGMRQDGRLVGGWGTVRDVTEQRLAAERHRSREALFQSVIEDVSDVITVVDTEGVIRYESPSLERVLGFHAEDLLGRDAFGLLHPEDLGRVAREFARLVDAGPGGEGATVGLRAAHKDGRWVPLEVSGRVVTAPGGAPMVVLSFRDVTERDRAERELRASEERFRGLFEASPFAIEILDAEGRLQLANRACLDMFGVVDAGELGRYRLFDDPQLPADARSCLLGGEIVAFEAPYDFDLVRERGVFRTTRSGRIHLRVLVAPLQAGQASSAGFLLQAEDVTERLRTERSLRVAQHALEVAADAVLWMRPDGTFHFVNAAAARLIGYPREELLAMSVLDLAPARASRGWEQAWERIRRGGSQQLETVLRTGRGDEVSVEVTAGHLELAGEAHCFAFVRDISERKRAEERLATLAVAVEQAADDILVTDAAGTITYVNSAFERTTGYPRDEALGRCPTFLDSGRHDASFYREIDEAIAAGRTWHGRFVNRTRDGRVILQDASISPILDPDGRVVGQVSARRDVTRQVQLEEHAAQADKLEALGTMAGGIAHDFNNILSAILGYTQMAMRRCPADSPVQRDLEAVLQGTRRAADLVKQILTFSRHQPREEQPVQVGLIVKEAAKLVRASIPTTVDIRADIRSESLVRAEPSDIHRIVVNLCTNAALAMREHGGVLELGLEDVELDATFAALHPGVSPGRHVRLRVSDDGEGMSDEVRARIFEPFYTTRERGQGTGMGLAVVHGVVTRCHGAIAVASRPGRGTTFEIHLPVVAQAAPAGDGPAEAPAAGGGRVLVVDDEPMVAAIVVEQLRHLGYEASSCASGPQALETFAADPGAVDVVVTDMTMPGMTGDVLARELKRLRPGLPVVLCTGYSDRVTAEAARRQGIDGFAMKPMMMAELAQVVGRALGRARG